MLKKILLFLICFLVLGGNYVDAEECTDPELVNAGLCDNGGGEPEINRGPCGHIYGESPIICSETEKYILDILTQTYIKYGPCGELYGVSTSCIDQNNGLYYDYTYDVNTDTYTKTEKWGPCGHMFGEPYIVCSDEEAYSFDYATNTYLRIVFPPIVINPRAPINLEQYMYNSLAEKETISTGSSVGKNQMGSGIRLGVAILEEANPVRVKLIEEIYKVGETTPIKITTSLNYYSTGPINFEVPYLGEGKYYWRARFVDENGNYSDWVDYGTNDINEVDFEMYEGFEPYSYGYRFENSGPSDGLLDGGISGLDLLNIGTRKIIPGKKWDIFNAAFDLSGYNEVKLMDAFENLELNKADAFQGGNCYGMAVSAVMQFKHPDFLSSYFSNFSSQIGDGYIWDKINIPSTSGSGAWDIYNDVSKMIYTLQLSQYSINDRITLFNSFSSGTTVLSKLSNNTSSGYIIGFLGKDKNGEVIGHAVVPYKVEGNKIYIWDNNIQYPMGEYYDSVSKKYIQYNAYSIYIEINSDGSWSIPMYNNDFASFDKISLININDLYNFGRKSGPSGFLGVDLKYTLSGKSDIIVTDSVGRISGFSGGIIIEEIPGVEIIVPLNYTLDGEITENTWKQIYLPQKQDLIVKVIAKGEESYDLMVAGGDYYTKLENIETSTGQVDTFESTVNNLKIDFDNTKSGSYNLLTDNFQENNTGTIYIESVPVITNEQEYNIDWIKVQTNQTDAVIQNIDTDNDGIYDEQIELPPVFQDILSPTTNYSFSGIQTPNTTDNSFIETTTITLTATDNEGGSGINNIYYSFNNTGVTDKVYLPYTEPIIVNGVNNYSLSYYSVDKYGNKEEVKIVDFELTKQDTIAPTTTAIFSGIQTPNTTNNSYIETVTIDLNTTDNEGGVGVNNTYYSLNNGEYQLYSNPIVVTGINNYTLNFYSTDNYGNQEETKTTTFELAKSDIISPTTSYSFSGTHIPNTTNNSFIETTTITLTATDNNGGVGINTIYYAIGTDIGTLIYVPYTEPIIVNGVGNYTLNYYAVDNYLNPEQTKTVNFTLTEQAETYQGEITGYVYEDLNSNGIKDTTEKTMAGWKICIDKNNNGDCEESIEPFDVTNNQGYYEFNGLASGTYKILEIPHQNWIVTNPPTKYYTITLSSGQKVTNKNFGNLKTKGK